jgi:shikimate dehydrogenase
MMTTIDGRTQLLGLLGWPVSHSFSPAMHNAAAAALGLNWAYVPLPVRPQDIEAAVRGLSALGFLGANVTVPHKQAVMPFLDEVSEAALRIGAVNTIVIEDGRCWGDNTDWIGFLQDLAALGVSAADRDCLVLGAGGSARGIVYALQQAHGRLHLLARRGEQAAALLDDMGLHSQGRAGALETLSQVAAGLHMPLIINTTPVGMWPHADSSIWPDDLALPQGAFVYDLVYNPRETQLMGQAVDSGCACSNGLGMLVRQGAAAFALWAGQEPDVDLMRQVVEAVV